ncbi:MAG: dolichyl-phosphate beta-glucosyltransferase [Aggregatilineales bacterium]
MPPFLSIIMPAHNEAGRLPPSLVKIAEFLQQQSYQAEVIVVENGSHDGTFEIADNLRDTYPWLRVMQVDTRGKGLAVKAGMLAADGDYRFICDVDLSMPIDEITKFLPPQLPNYDVMIGSREGEGAQRIGEPEYRHIMGRILTMIVKLTAVRGFEDTQCGFKMFSREAAEDLFAVQQMHGIGFDVELIFIAKRRGYQIVDVPITWYYDDDSRMRLVQDSLHILAEIWQIRRNWRRGLYERQSPDPKKEKSTP